MFASAARNHFRFAHRLGNGLDVGGEKSQGVPATAGGVGEALGVEHLNAPTALDDTSFLQRGD